MDRLQAMQVFVNVVELGTFAAAASTLGLHRPAVTLAVQQLERTLGSALLIRNTRNVNLTPEGEAFYRRCVVVLADVTDAFAQFSSAPVDPVGRLHIDISAAFADAVVLPALAAFKTAYPRIALSIGSSDRPIDLQEEDIDCMVRLGPTKQSGCVSRKVGVVPMVTCAAPAYLAQHGQPKRLRDLDGHLAVNMVAGVGRRVRDWHFLENRKDTRIRLQSAMITDNTSAQIACALAGMGLLQTIRPAVATHLASGALVEVLPRVPAVPTDVTLLHPALERVPAQTRVFIDWLSALLA